MRHFSLYAGVIAAIWLSLSLYGDTLGLPFLQDDFAHIRWLAQMDSLIEPFLTAAGRPAYRPLGKSIWMFWQDVLGHHDATWLRFLNISFHSLNIALVAAMGRRLARRPAGAASSAPLWVGGLAAIFFSALPFAYQAIPWINLFFYPLNNLLQLFMVFFYWEGRVRHDNRWLALAFVFAFVSPFEIEYGLVNGGLLLAVEVALWLQRRQARIWLGGPLIALALNLVYLAIWLAVPKVPYTFGGPTPERVGQIAVYLLQGLTYPVSPLALPLMERTGLSDLAAILVVGLPALALLALVLLRWGRRALLAAGLIWFVAPQVPGLITLTFDYYVNSPRLLYPSGPAMAWLWAAFFVALASGRRWQRLRLAIAVPAVLAILWVSIGFVRLRVEHHHIVGDVIDQLGDIPRRSPPNEKVLLVNVPSWLTPAERTFALGNNGVQFIPFYIPIADVLYGAAGQDHPVDAVEFHNIRQPQPYFYGMLGQTMDWDTLRAQMAGSGDVYVTHYSPAAVELQPVGRASAVGWNESAAGGVTFDGRVALQLADHTLTDERVALALRWQLRQPINDDLTVFVHLYGPDGALVAQDDGYPLRGLSPFWLWEAGRTLEDRRTLPWPAGAPDGVYRVGVGVYDRATGQRLPAFDAAGRRLPDDVAILLEVARP